MIRTAGVLLVVVALASIPTFAVGAAVAQAGPVRVEVSVDEGQLAVDLTSVSEPIGALEIEVAGVPELAAPCELQSGFGACTQADGVLRIVALNPTGWTDDATLLEVELAAPISGALDVTVPVLTDVDGMDLPVVSAAPERVGSGEFDAEGVAPGPVVIIAIVVAVVIIGIAGYFRRARRFGSDVGD